MPWFVCILTSWEGLYLKISAMELTKSSEDGLLPFPMQSLGTTVVLTGRNGSGKTRLLKLIEKTIRNLQSGNMDSPLQLTIEEGGKEVFLTVDNANCIEVVNYSHFDAQLQSPKGFTPYVIQKAKDILQVCNYEETALNSLLLLEDLANGYSEEFKDGREFERFSNGFAKDLGIQIKKDPDTGELQLFGQSIEKAGLSPGQQYLLRIAIACYRNQNKPQIIFLMDEPELHLHPEALISFMNQMRQKFATAQFIISTHSLELISYFSVTERNNATILHLDCGKVGILRSNSEALVKGLIGSDKNLFAIQQLMAMPDEYACNKFAAQTFDPPLTLPATGKDPQVETLIPLFCEGDIVVDYGAGKGRFFEELALADQENNTAKGIKYYAFDPDNKDAAQCKQVMKRYGSSEKNYSNNIDEFLQTLNKKVDYVLLVNVLHEIEPIYWCEVFNNIHELLNDSGKLIIVEREELTIGERAYTNGFLVITPSGANELFGEKNYRKETHNNKKYIVKYTVQKQALQVTPEKVQQCIAQIRQYALEQITMLKHSDPPWDDLGKYQAGIKLAFQLHQFANASLILNKV